MLHFFFTFIYQLNSPFQILYFCRNFEALILKASKCKSRFVTKVLKYVRFVLTCCRKNPTTLHCLHKLIMVTCKFRFDLSCSKAMDFFLRLFVHVYNPVKWTQHIIFSMYYTFETSYFLLVEWLILWNNCCWFFGDFFFRWDTYLNIFLFIIIYILVYWNYLIQKKLLGSANLGHGSL